MTRRIFAILHHAIAILPKTMLGNPNTVSPEKVVRSIPEAWFDLSVRKHVVGMKIMRPAGIETYAFPETLPPAFRTQMHFAQRHVYHLRDLSVNVKTGSCVAGSSYFQESYGSLRRCLLEKPFPVSRGHLVNNNKPITCVHAACYYHFLLEELPRLLWTLHYHPNVTVMVHHSAPLYVMQALDVLNNLGHEFNIVATVDDAVYLSNYVFTQAEAYSGFVHTADLMILRKHLLKYSTTTGAERIYITRRKATRCFDNEANIVSFMRESGFQIYSLEELDFETQINIFQKAKVVVAAHGAGLSNISWCNAGTRVIEIFSPRYFNDCYARICSQLQLLYKPVWAQATQGWGRVSPEELSLALTGSVTEPSPTLPGKQ